MLYFGSYKTEKCAECSKEMEAVGQWGPCLYIFAVVGTFLLAGLTDPSVTLFLICTAIFLPTLIALLYIKTGRRVFHYTSKDSKGRWHTHLDEPQKKCGAYICLADFTHAEDMIIKEPIFKIHVRGWGPKRHEILNGNYGNWKLSDFYVEIGSFSPVLTLDNGITRQKNVTLKLAYQIVQSRYQPICALAEYDPEKTRHLMEIAASHAVMSAVVRDVIELIGQWKGSSSSKVGMAARMMLEKAEIHTACEITAGENPHLTARSCGLTPIAIDAPMAERIGSWSRSVNAAIAAQAAQSLTLRHFVAGKPQYLPPTDEPVNKTAGAIA
ncbi:MAG: hypothetical protein WC654_07950 [Patescibacteria group bacterium]